MEMNEDFGDLREIAVKLGVPPTVTHINHRIEEMGEIEKGLLEFIAEEVGCSKVERIDILDGDRQLLVDKVVAFRRKYWKLKARADHLHELAYLPLWRIILFRMQLFFVYPIERLFRREL